MSLRDFQNAFASSIYGLTKEEAHKKKICIDCKRPVDPEKLKQIDRDEYNISGLCPSCWDKIMGSRN